MIGNNIQNVNPLYMYQFSDTDLMSAFDFHQSSLVDFVVCMGYGGIYYLLFLNTKNVLLLYGFSKMYIVFKCMFYLFFNM